MYFCGKNLMFDLCSYFKQLKYLSMVVLSRFMLPGISVYIVLGGVPI